MQNGANVNAITKDGFCALKIAAKENHVEIAELLIRHGADMENGSVISQKPLPLLMATYGNSYEFVKLLIENGANINAQDPSNGWTQRIHQSILNGTCYNLVRTCYS